LGAITLEHSSIHPSIIKRLPAIKISANTLKQCFNNLSDFMQAKKIEGSIGTIGQVFGFFFLFLASIAEHEKHHREFLLKTYEEELEFNGLGNPLAFVNLMSTPEGLRLVFYYTLGKEKIFRDMWLFKKFAAKTSQFSLDDFLDSLFSLIDLLAPLEQPKTYQRITNVFKSRIRVLANQEDGPSYEDANQLIKELGQIKNNASKIDFEVEFFVLDWISNKLNQQDDYKTAILTTIINFKDTFEDDELLDQIVWYFLKDVQSNQVELNFAKRLAARLKIGSIDKETFKLNAKKAFKSESIVLEFFLKVVKRDMDKALLVLQLIALIIFLDGVGNHANLVTLIKLNQIYLTKTPASPSNPFTQIPILINNPLFQSQWINATDKSEVDKLKSLSRLFPENDSLRTFILLLSEGKNLTNKDLALAKHILTYPDDIQTSLLATLQAINPQFLTYFSNGQNIASLPKRDSGEKANSYFHTSIEITPPEKSKKVNWQDAENVLEAVKLNGLNLTHAPEKFKNNKKIVAYAVQQNGLALQFATYRLRSDRDVCLLALKNNSFAIKYVGNVDLSIELLSIYQSNGLMIKYAPLKDRQQQEYVRLCMKQHFYAFVFSSEHIIESVCHYIDKHGNKNQKQEFVDSIVTILGLESQLPTLAKVVLKYFPKIKDGFPKAYKDTKLKEKSHDMGDFPNTIFEYDGFTAARPGSPMGALDFSEYPSLKLNQDIVRDQGEITFGPEIETLDFDQDIILEDEAMDTIVEKLKTNPQLVLNYPDDFINDDYFIEMIIEEDAIAWGKNTHPLRIATQKVKTSKMLFNASTKKDPNFMVYFDRLKVSQKILDELQKNPNRLVYFLDSDQYKVFLDAFKPNPKNDEEILKAISKEKIHSKPQVILDNIFSKKVRSKDVAAILVKDYGPAMAWFGIYHRDDEDLAKSALKANPFSWAFISPTLRAKLNPHDYLFRKVTTKDRLDDIELGIDADGWPVDTKISMMSAIKDYFGIEESYDNDYSDEYFKELHKTEQSLLAKLTYDDALAIGSSLMSVVLPIIYLKYQVKPQASLKNFFKEFCLPTIEFPVDHNVTFQSIDDDLSGRINFIGYLIAIELDQVLDQKLQLPNLFIDYQYD